MFKRFVLWVPGEGLPTWWLCLIILRLLWLGPQLTSDSWPLAGQLALSVVTFLVTLPLAIALTRWLTARLNDGPGEGRTGRPSEGSVGGK
jgi:hypothetical protein